MPDKDKPRTAQELVEQKLQAIKTSRAAESETAAAPTTPAAPAGMGMGNELDMLRSIMLGSLQRDMDRRLGEMNDSVEALSAMLTERSEQISADMDTRFAALQKESSERGVRQTSDQSAALSKMQQQIDQSMAELRTQMKTLTEESLKRQDALRSEIMGLLKALEDSKTSRQAMGDMLIEMGQRLRGNK